MAIVKYSLGTRLTWAQDLPVHTVQEEVSLGPRLPAEIHSIVRTLSKFSAIGQLSRNKPIIMTSGLVPRFLVAPLTDSQATRLHDIIDQNLAGRHSIQYISHQH